MKINPQLPLRQCFASLPQELLRLFWLWRRSRRPRGTEFAGGEPRSCHGPRTGQWREPVEKIDKEDQDDSETDYIMLDF